MGKVARYLNQLTVGEVFDANDILEDYATDRSVLKIKPKLVALPESTEDVQKLVRFCYQLANKGMKLPITVRGSGLDEMGADIGNGLVISTKKLNRLLEADKRERLVRVQAGITLKELNTALSLNGLTIPIAGHEMETIGGLISNCPVDDYAKKYGGIMNYVERIEVILLNGDVLQTMRISKRAIKKKSGRKNLEGQIYEKISKLIDKNETLIKNMPKTVTNHAGYPEVAYVYRDRSVDLMPLFFGAQGTLGIITEVILRSVPIESKTRRVAATFEDFEMAQKFADMLAQMKPRKLDIYDIRIVKMIEDSGKKLGKIISKMDSGFVILAEFDHKYRSAFRKIASVRNVLPKSTRLLLEYNENDPDLNEIDNSLVSFSNQTQSTKRLPLLVDFFIPPTSLVGFIKDLKVLEKSLGMELALYGSYATNNYSLRPKFNIEEQDFNKKAISFIRAGAYVIKRRNGELAGGAPEGRIKALITNDEMMADQMALYAGIKNIFDKYEILNPGVKIGADATYTVRHFRKS